MKLEQAREIIACLTQRRTLFSYGKDLYAFQLLRHIVGEGCTVTSLRKTTFSSLLEKPTVRTWLGQIGRAKIQPSDLYLYYPVEIETYRLNLDTFDGWDQTSRTGVNLVLQMNLNGRDAQYVEKHIPERSDDPFEYYCHPISSGRHRTLAWSRIDIDLDRGEALIEEIQNDRIRDVGWALGRLQRLEAKTINWGGTKLTREFLSHYWNEVLRLSRQFWDEAMLSATLHFLIEDIGIRNIYYHTPRSGIVYKGRGCINAPTSLYTKLPRKFCFQQTDECPSFLKPKKKPAPFMKLDLCA